MDETRDTELGRRLEALIEPDHGSDYWRDVRLQVAEASAEAGRPGFGTRLRAALARRPLRLALAAVALAAVAAAALLVGLPRTLGPQTVSATEVLERAFAAYSSGRTWQADVVMKYPANEMLETPARYGFDRYRVLRDTGGSYRATAYEGSGADRHATDVITYDAVTGVLRSSDGRKLLVEQGHPLGPPDTWLDPLGHVDLGATLRAVAASGELRLAEAVTDGRPAWTVTCTKGEMAGLPPSNVSWPVYTITVDKQTWMPVRFQEAKAGTVIVDVNVRNVRIDEPLPEHAFTLRAVPGMTVKRVDGGFRRVALDEAATVPGVTPLVPGFVPDGYKLTSVAVAARSLSDNGMVMARHVFALQYTAGFDALTVSTRTIHDEYYTADHDPVDEAANPTWSKLARKEATIAAGAFAGVTAKILVATPWSTPHLWAVKDGVLLTIAGGATAKELLSVAESLQVYPTASASPAE